MRALGVWCKKDELLLAMSVDGELVDDPDQEIVSAPELLEATEGLATTLSDLKRELSEIRPDIVRILLPQQTYSDVCRVFLRALRGPAPSPAGRLPPNSGQGSPG